MRRAFVFLLILVPTGVAALLIARHFGATPVHAAGTEKQLYTCGMHPQIIQDKPGDCPICDMKLQPVRKQASSVAGAQPGAAQKAVEGKIAYYKSTMMPGEISQTPGKDSMGMDMVPVYEGAKSDNSTISIDPATIQSMGIRVGEVTSGPLRRSVRTVGVVDFNEATLSDISMKFKGWIEKLHVDATGRVVKKGEPLFETYAPEVYNAELEFASLKRSGNQALAKTTLERLNLLNVPAAELDQLAATGQPSRTIAMLAPADGVVIEKTAVAGMMFEPGANLYRIADLSTVWLKAQIYEQDMAFVRVGQEATVTIDSLPGQKFTGRVTYIYPTLDPKTRTAQARMEFGNPGFLLKPGMFAKVGMDTELAPSVTLAPESAILRSGDRATVFLALAGGKFEPREVALGQRDSSGLYQILGGLTPGDKVVTSAQFMLDSESQLREAIEKMRDTAPGAPAPAEPQAKMSPLPDAKASGEPKTFVCPMEEHQTIAFDHPGKCPLCGMKLVPGVATAQPAATPAPPPADHAPDNH